MLFRSASASDSSHESVNGNNDRDKSALRDDGNWFDYDPRANGGMMLSIASKRIAEAGSREQRWIASAAGIKSSIGSRSSIGNNDNDNNGIKASASLLLNGPSSPTRLNSHLKPTSPDPDPIATQVHEPIVLSQVSPQHVLLLSPVPNCIALRIATCDHVSDEIDDIGWKTINYG